MKNYPLLLLLIVVLSIGCSGPKRIFSKEDWFPELEKQYHLEDYNMILKLWDTTVYLSHISSSNDHEFIRANTSDSTHREQSIVFYSRRAAISNLISAKDSSGKLVTSANFSPKDIKRITLVNPQTHGKDEKSIYGKHYVLKVITNMLLSCLLILVIISFLRAFTMY